MTLEALTKGVLPHGKGDPMFYSDQPQRPQAGQSPQEAAFSKKPVSSWMMGSFKPPTHTQNPKGSRGVHSTQNT